MKLSRCSRGHFYNGGKYASCPYCPDGSDSQQDSYRPDPGGYQDGEEVTQPVGNYVYNVPHPEQGYSGDEEEITVPLYPAGENREQPEQRYSDDKEEITVPLYPAGENREQPEQRYSGDEEEITIPLYPGGENRPTRDKIAQERPKAKVTEANEPEPISVSDKNCRSNMPAAGWLVCIEGRNQGRDYRIVAGKNTIGRGKNNSITLTEDTSVAWEPQISVVYEAETNTIYALPEISRNLSYVNGQIIIERTELKKNDVLELGTCKLMLIPCCDDKFHWNVVYGNESKNAK